MREARALLVALRGHMPKAGFTPINPWTTDEHDEEAQSYRELVESEPPIYGSAKFRIGEHWYLYDQARPLIRAELELDKPKSKRSEAAVWLAVALHAKTLDDYAVFRAWGKCELILAELRPI